MRKRKKTVWLWGGKREKKGEWTCFKWMDGGKCVGPTVCSDSKIQNWVSGRVTGVTKGDGRVVNDLDGRRRGMTGESSTLKTPVNIKWPADRRTGRRSSHMMTVNPSLTSGKKNLILLRAIETYWKTSYSKTCWKKIQTMGCLPFNASFYVESSTVQRGNIQGGHITRVVACPTFSAGW